MIELSRVVCLLAAASCRLRLGAATGADGAIGAGRRSLQESMTPRPTHWARPGHPRPVMSFAASSALARQIEAGAPADLFVSADEEWMDALAAKRLIATGTRADLVGNRLVVVEPAATAHARSRSRGAALARVLGAGPLAMADPDSVPAGKYGKAALARLGAWDAVAPHVVRAENVRAALALVERGAAPFGIVYATDAKASSKVRVAGVFPAASHPPIVYPIARLAGSTNPEARGFPPLPAVARGARRFSRGSGSPRRGEAARPYLDLCRGWDDDRDRASSARGRARVDDARSLCCRSRSGLSRLAMLRRVRAAWFLARAGCRGKILIEAIVYLPLVVPPVVTGWMLLLAFAPAGPFGGAGRRRCCSDGPARRSRRA